MAVSPSRLKAMGSAVIAGDARKVRLLLRAGVPPGAGDGSVTFPEAAAMNADEGMFFLLADAGADTSDPEVLTAAAGGDGRGGPTLARIVDALLGTHRYDQAVLDDALRYACVAGGVRIVRALLDAGGDPNGVDGLGFFPLRNAVQEGHAEVVRVLLAAGANPAAHPVFEESGGGADSGTTLPEFAARQGRADVRALLRDLGTTPAGVRAA